MSEIYIYTGEKGIGKSTLLQKLFLKKENVCGIIQPRSEGIKYLVDIESGEKRKLELDAKESEAGTISIGNYLFSEETFLWGQQKLNDAVTSTNKLLIVDEIGPLELRGSGLEPDLTKIISSSIDLKIKLLLVVRPALIELVIANYNLLSPIIIRHGTKIPSDLTQ